MPLLLIVTFGALVSFSDIDRHVISNVTLAYFLFCVISFNVVHGEFVAHALFTLKVLAILVVFQWLTAGVMGMGDVKYLLVLALLIGAGSIYLRGLIFSILLAGCTGFGYFIIQRSFHVNIPLAPAITLGFLLAFAC